MCPLVTPDFTDEVKKNEPGTYLCRIHSSEMRTAKSSGNCYLAWKLYIHPGGRAVFYNTPLVGKGSGLFKHFVHAAGDEAYEAGPYDSDKLNGKYVEMKLEVDEHGYFKVKEVHKVNQMNIPSNPIDLNTTEDDIPW